MASSVSSDDEEVGSRAQTEGSVREPTPERCVPCWFKRGVSRPASQMQNAGNYRSVRLVCPPCRGAVRALELPKMTEGCCGRSRLTLPTASQSRAWS